MTEQYRSGNEFLPFHPQASHVSPDYRDGWNACWQAAIASREPAKDIDMEALKRGRENAVTAWAGVDFATFGSASREPMTQQQQASIMHPDDDMATFIRTIASVERFHGIGE